MTPTLPAFQHKVLSEWAASAGPTRRGMIGEPHRQKRLTRKQTDMIWKFEGEARDFWVFDRESYTMRCEEPVIINGVRWYAEIHRLPNHAGIANFRAYGKRLADDGSIEEMPER